MKFLEEAKQYPPVLNVSDDRHSKIITECFRKLGFEEPLIASDIEGTRDASDESPKSIVIFEWNDLESTTLLNHMKGNAFFDTRPIIILASEPSHQIFRTLSEFRISFIRFGKQEPKSLLNDIVESFNPEHPVNSLIRAFQSLEDARQHNDQNLILQLLGAMVDRYPKNFRLHTEYAAAKIGNGQFEDAEELLDELLILEQNLPRAHYLKSLCLKDRGEAKEAFEYLKTSIRLNNSHSDRVTDYAQILLENQSSDKAKKYFLHAWKLDKRNERTFKGIVSAKLLDGDFEDAAKYMNKISSQKERASALNLAGVTAVKKGNFHLAEKMYEQAKEFIKDREVLARVIYNQALAAAQMKMKKETIQYLKEAQSLDPSYGKVQALAKKLDIDLSA